MLHLLNTRLCSASQTARGAKSDAPRGSVCVFSDFPMQLNMALFEFNGRTGYLLKHDVLRRGDKTFNPFCERIDTVVAVTLTIKAGLQALAQTQLGSPRGRVANRIKTSYEVSSTFLMNEATAIDLYSNLYKHEWTRI